MKRPNGRRASLDVGAEKQRRRHPPPSNLSLEFQQRQAPDKSANGGMDSSLISCVKHKNPVPAGVSGNRRVLQ